MIAYSEEAAAEDACDREDAERTEQMRQAREEYDAHRAQEQEQEECPHDEHDHGICLSCGKDIFDDLVGRADFMRDE